MPQMSPISWLTLFIIFSIALMLFSVMNYYSNISNPPKSGISFKHPLNSLNWKW